MAADGAPAPTEEPRESSLDRQLSAALESLSLAAPEGATSTSADSKADPSSGSSTLSSQAQSKPSARVALYTAPVCALHNWIRTPSSSHIVERPQRLRAVAVGLACGLARLEEVLEPNRESVKASSEGGPSPSFVRLVPLVSYEDIDIRTHPATRYVHQTLVEGESDPSLNESVAEQEYLLRLYDLIESCTVKVASKQIEIPEEWPQGDLYLSPGSLLALKSSIATVCSAVDLVLSPAPSPKRAFASIRPPGHHCSSDVPAGFCFINNVAIAAMHANLHHSIDHIAIFDIDLHHGNGTQAIVWAINEATHRQTLGARPLDKRGPQIYYGSLHDILSYPCETGDLALTQAASICIHGAHGQHIENIHLEPYTSDTDFWGRLYPEKYSNLLSRADEFFERTGADPSKSLILVSCGFDACSHELESMSRHKRNVPPTFYARFAADVHSLAEKRTNGRAVTVLEGGYGDRALESGAMAYLVGMFSQATDIAERQKWWNLEELVKIEKAFPAPKQQAAKKPRPSNPGLFASPYLARAASLLPEILPALPPEVLPLPVSAPASPAAREPHRMGLRDRKMLKPPVVDDATPPRLEVRGKEKVAKPRRGGKSNNGTPTRLPVPPAVIDSNSESPIPTPTVEVPPVPSSAVEGLARTMSGMSIKDEKPEEKPVNTSLKVKVRLPQEMLEKYRQAGQADMAPSAVPVVGPSIVTARVDVQSGEVHDEAKPESQV